jgi:type IV secretory pathway VirB3-like protein
MGYSNFEKLWFSSISFTTLFIKGVARPFSFFQSPAAFADFMLLAMVGVIVTINSSKKASTRYLLILIPLYVCALLITSVRSNWIGAIIVLFLDILTWLNNWHLRIGVIVFLALCLYHYS